MTKSKQLTDKKWRRCRDLEVGKILRANKKILTIEAFRIANRIADEKYGRYEDQAVKTSPYDATKKARSQCQSALEGLLVDGVFRDRKRAYEWIGNAMKLSPKESRLERLNLEQLGLLLGYFHEIEIEAEAAACDRAIRYGMKMKKESLTNKDN